MRTSARHKKYVVGLATSVAGRTVALSTKSVTPARQRGGYGRIRPVIHNDNPFATMDSPTKRLRGRLGSSVTVITSGTPENRTGLTVSSLVVVEGEPGLILAVVGPNSDLFDVASETGKFVVHLGKPGQAGLADVFAGIRPSPGGKFAGLSVNDTAWGPAIGEMPTRAYCSEATIEPVRWSGILTGTIDDVDFDADPEPLIHYRGGYRRLSAPESRSDFSTEELDRP